MARGRAEDSDRAVYVISVAAELAGVHPQTLRIYERKGLLEPARTSGNSRRYSEADIALLRRIQVLTQNEGVNLAGVRKAIALEQRLAAAEKEIRRLRADLEATRVAGLEAVEAARRENRRELVLYRRPMLPVPKSKR